MAQRNRTHTSALSAIMSRVTSNIAAFTRAHDRAESYGFLDVVIIQRPALITSTTRSTRRPRTK